jgi:hypothetical protein
MAESEEVDIAKVNEYVKGLVDTHVQDALKQYQPPVQQTQQQQLSQEQAAQLQLQQLLEPFIAPRVNAAQLTAADARDMSSFYSDSDNLSMKDEVEKMFDELKTAGRAIPRADIKRYLLGKEYEADPIKFTEKQQERRKSQVRTAESAIDMGQGSVERAKADATFGNGNVWTMPLEELEKALQGITF